MRSEAESVPLHEINEFFDSRCGDHEIETHHRCPGQGPPIPAQEIQPMRTKLAIAATVLSTLALAGCGEDVPPRAAEPTTTPPGTTAEAAAPQAETETVTETVTVTATETVTEKAEPEEPATPPEPVFETSEFGVVSFFTSGQGAEQGEFSLTVEQPYLAQCRYSSIGCDSPHTGDSVVTTPLVFENTGTSPVTVSSNQFEVEFTDGTRMAAGDGAAREYRTDSSLDYERTIRPGATLSTNLTFEAPEGEFSIILMTSTWDGEDLHAWTGSL